VAKVIIKFKMCPGCKAKRGLNEGTPCDTAPQKNGMQICVTCGDGGSGGVYVYCSGDEFYVCRDCLAEEVLIG
jgi:hypothetical protein